MKDKCYLNYNQIQIMLYKLNEIKKDFPYYNDGVVSSFEDYVVDRTNEIAKNNLNAVSKMFPNINKYVIKNSMFDYITRLIGINVLDENIVNEYTPIVNEITKKTVDEFMKSEGKKYKH